MNEAYLRKWHRRMGILLALFIFLQATSGIVVNSDSLLALPSLAVYANVLHRGGGEFGTLYRTFLGLGLMGMAASGSLIFYLIWQRTRKQ
jgi:hypothetical protein